MKNTTPRHRRINSKEFQTGIAIMEALRKAGCLVPTPSVHRMEMALVDMIAVGMGTARAEDLPVVAPVSISDQEFIDSLIES